LAAKKAKAGRRKNGTFLKGSKAAKAAGRKGLRAACASSKKKKPATRKKRRSSRQKSLF
tara:strand:+ start:763 stop:939 length:177 start_codon:yes stop_codon:yes gene_type:complete